MFDMPIASRHSRTSEPLSHAVELRFEHSPVSELEQANPLGGCACDHRSKRSENSGDHDRCNAGCLVWGSGEGAAEGFMEAAGRFEPVRVGGAFPLLALPNLSEGESQPACSLVGLEGQPVVSEEPAAYASGIKLRFAQV